MPAAITEKIATLLYVKDTEDLLRKQKEAEMLFQEVLALLKD